MVHREVERQVHPNAHGPGGISPRLDLLDRLLDKPGVQGQQGFETVWRRAAEVVQKAVICPHELGVNGKVVVAPGHSGHHELDVHAFFVHIPKPALRDPLPVGGRKLGAHKFLAAALGVGLGLSLAERAGCVRAPAAAKAAQVVPVGIWRFQRGSRGGPPDRVLVLLQVREHLLDPGGQIGFEPLCRRSDVGIGVVDLHAVSHGSPPLLTMGLDLIGRARSIWVPRFRISEPVKPSGPLCISARNIMAQREVCLCRASDF